ncbi:MAG: hypothetical protein HYY40_07310 [Bacteroidetes bacterium]|nr:hypothetical protein [Bacteroidota bacterium]
MKTAIVVFSIIFCTLFYSCIQIKQYPPEPSIAFVNYYSKKDTQDLLGNNAYFGKITVSFLDGDGDIGLEEADTFPPYDTASAFYYNLFVKQVRKKDTVITFKEYNSRMPSITPKGQNKTLQGEIDVFVLITLPFPDSIKYEIRIADRSLHESNTVTTSMYPVY